jgi:hypothetical protein
MILRELLASGAAPRPRLRQTLDGAGRCGDSQCVSVVEPESQPAATDPAPVDEPRWVAVIHNGGRWLYMAGLAGVTLLGWLSSALLLISAGVFAVGAAMEGAAWLYRYDPHDQ